MSPGGTLYDRDGHSLGTARDNEPWNPFDKRESAVDRKHSTPLAPVLDNHGRVISPEDVAGILNDQGRISPGGTLYDDAGHILGRKMAPSGYPRDLEKEGKTTLLIHLSIILKA